MLELIDGTLALEAISHVDAHLAACPRCRRWISELTRGSGATPRLSADSRTWDEPMAAEIGPRKELACGDRVGRYRVQSRVGAGAMASSMRPTIRSLIERWRSS